MKMRLLAIVGLAIGLVAPAVAQEKMGACTGPQDACQAAEDLAKSYEAAFNRKDAAAVAALYTQDGVFVPEGPILSGREAITKATADAIKAGFSDLAIHTAQAHVVGDMAWVVGDYSQTGPGQNQTTQRYRGNYGAVDVRDGGTWKIRMLTINMIENRPSQGTATASPNR